MAKLLDNLFPRWSLNRTNARLMLKVRRLQEELLTQTGPSGAYFQAARTGREEQGFPMTNYFGDAMFIG